MAEGEGFEPSRPLLRAYSLSRGAPSAARPSLRGAFYGRRKPSENEGPGKERIRRGAIPTPFRRHPGPARARASRDGRGPRAVSAGHETGHETARARAPP